MPPVKPRSRAKKEQASKSTPKFEGLEKPHQISALEYPIPSVPVGHLAPKVVAVNPGRNWWWTIMGSTRKRRSQICRTFGMIVTLRRPYFAVNQPGQYGGDGKTWLAQPTVGPPQEKHIDARYETCWAVGPIQPPTPNKFKTLSFGIDRKHAACCYLKLANSRAHCQSSHRRINMPPFYSWPAPPSNLRKAEESVLFQEA